MFCYYEMLQTQVREYKTRIAIPESIQNYRFLHFPPHSYGNPGNVDQFRWSLLTLDTEKNQWNFYNSLKPRRASQRDDYIIDAQDMVSLNFLRILLINS